MEGNQSAERNMLGLGDAIDGSVYGVMSRFSFSASLHTTTHVYQE
jgi:hypothetical protein